MFLVNCYSIVARKIICEVGIPMLSMSSLVDK